MSGPDWSKAPKGAEYWVDPLDSSKQWYRICEGLWQYHCIARGWMFCWVAPTELSCRLIKRP
mgnify:CR=1 FL=1